ncbi:VCBS repeat-containing protein [Streptomyces sp. NBC_00727]|uniref:FG-GAP repeat domain-containing protein n=1 Tax=Streptomyces sp. NBC_00727 TaxID=2903675 RepID=UPI0038663E7F
MSIAALAAVLAASPGSAAVARTDESPAVRAAELVTEKGAQADTGVAASASASDAAVFGIFGIDAAGKLYSYAPDGSGSLARRELLASDYEDVRMSSSADDDGDGVSDDTWVWTTAGGLASSYGYGYVGGGWNIYDVVFSPGSLGGAKGYDVLGRDAAGKLWLYFGYSDGTLTARHEIGSGWGQYTQIAGKGDLTGDGKPDIVARDTTGMLWLYKGTGDAAAPFAAKTKIGSGWNQYDSLVGAGDIDLDGRADLIARNTAGDLFLYKGTGNAAAPYEPKKQIGYGYDIYRVMFS